MYIEITSVPYPDVLYLSKNSSSNFITENMKLLPAEMEPCLECTSTMLNINYEHNRKLMKKS